LFIFAGRADGGLPFPIQGDMSGSRAEALARPHRAQAASLEIRVIRGVKPPP
jgi:hypothetical protein